MSYNARRQGWGYWSWTLGLISRRCPGYYLTATPMSPWPGTLQPNIKKKFYLWLKKGTKIRSCLKKRNPFWFQLYLWYTTCLRCTGLLYTPLGRLIISRINSVTSRVGKYIYHFLQHLVIQTPLFLRDSTQVINTLNIVKWKDSYILATADVLSLYMIISHQHGREAVRHYLETDSLVSSQRDFVLSLLDFAMGRNYFWFSGSYYLQNKGVAMERQVCTQYGQTFYG